MDKSVENSDDCDNSDDCGGVVDLPVSDMDDESLWDTMEDLEDTTQIQYQSII